jgi:hypothetical protein
MKHSISRQVGLNVRLLIRLAVVGSTVSPCASCPPLPINPLFAFARPHRTPSNVFCRHG